MICSADRIASTMALIVAGTRAPPFRARLGIEKIGGGLQGRATASAKTGTNSAKTEWGFFYETWI